MLRGSQRFCLLFLLLLNLALRLQRHIQLGRFDLGVSWELLALRRLKRGIGGLQCDRVVIVVISEHLEYSECLILWCCGGNRELDVVDVKL